MIRTLLLAAGTAAAFASSAMAKDGFRIYAGPLIGYDNVELDFGTIDLGSENDVMYGGVAGIDFQLAPKGTFGVEAEYSDSKVEVSGSDLFVFGDQGRLSAGRDLYIGVRSTYIVTPSVLIYAKVGYTNARVKYFYDDGNGFVVQDHTDRHGFRFGPGVELVLNKNLGIRAEYRRSEYKSKDIGLSSNIDANRDQFVAGVVVGF